MFSMKITARPYTTPGVKVRGDICLSGNTSGTNVPPLKATVLGNISEGASSVVTEREALDEFIKTDCQLAELSNPVGEDITTIGRQVVSCGILLKQAGHMPNDFFGRNRPLQLIGLPDSHRALTYEVIFAKQGDYGFETDKRFVFPVNLFGTFMSTLKDRVNHSTWSIAEEISVALCCNEIPDRVDTVLFWLKFPWNRQS